MSRLCDPTLSAFEPEARGQLVHGMDFHKFYFDLKRSESPSQTNISRHMCGDWARTWPWSATCD